MATKYGLALALPFVKGTAGSSLETLRKNHKKDDLIYAASSLGWLVRDTLGIDIFRACLNLVESSPGCGGGMERLAKAYKMGRLGPYKKGALNAAKITTEEFVSHMASFGLDSYGEPLGADSGDGDDEEAAAAAAALNADSQLEMKTQGVLKDSQREGPQQRDSLLFSLPDEELPGLGLLDPDGTPAVPANQVSAGAGDGGEDGDSGDGGDGGGSDVAKDDARKGRNLQTQFQSQGTFSARPKFKKSKICRSVRGNGHCLDKDCNKDHPPRCGDPQCFPRRRRDCPHWHDLRNVQGKAQGQGNVLGAAPGRAGRREHQGSRQHEKQHFRQRCPQPQQQWRWRGEAMPGGAQQQQRWHQQRGQSQQQQRQPWQWQRGRMPQQQAPGWLGQPPQPQHHKQQQHQGPRLYSDVLKGDKVYATNPIHLLLDRLAVIEAALARVQCSGSYPGM